MFSLGCFKRFGLLCNVNNNNNRQTLNRQQNTTTDKGLLRVDVFHTSKIRNIIRAYRSGKPHSYSGIFTEAIGKDRPMTIRLSAI